MGLHFLTQLDGPTLVSGVFISYLILSDHFYDNSLDKFTVHEIHTLNSVLSLQKLFEIDTWNFETRNFEFVETMTM